MQPPSKGGEPPVSTFSHSSFCTSLIRGPTAAPYQSWPVIFLKILVSSCLYLLFAYKQSILFIKIYGRDSGVGGLGRLVQKQASGAGGHVFVCLFSCSHWFVASAVMNFWPLSPCSPFSSVSLQWQNILCVEGHTGATANSFLVAIPDT